MQEAAKIFLPAEDQDVRPEDFQPPAKVICFQFYSMIYEGSYPPPINRCSDVWYYFGFVVCDNEYEERRLCELYSRELFGLLNLEEYGRNLGIGTRVFHNWQKHNLCTFDFWRSWEAGGLIPTFERYNPRFEKDYPHPGFPIHRLRNFLSHKASEERPAIWHLRHFLALKNTPVVAATGEIASAAREYGSHEDLDKVTEGGLREFYIQLGRREEPWNVQQKREAGNLLAFATRLLATISPRV
ncbi:uncharacterized protein DNG_05815 [Cephalotrichum gorgonifer]|uniref:Uncharacterized protein n=1 Tax=Cephalotrichum gorgonifer TaxID=2041049 RepID=A0AAE8SVW0_9PEZI|nr:uncharacterized protein DNG_05815 [Cephalotrichum gorgonifer]